MEYSYHRASTQSIQQDDGTLTRKDVESQRVCPVPPAYAGRVQDSSFGSPVLE
jgi:hypothetical protein